MRSQDDPTIQRIRETRHRISEACDHDPKKIVDYYLKLQKKYKSRLLKEAEQEAALDQPVKA